MEIRDYYLQLNRLSKVYEPQYFQPERVEILFRRYQERSIQDFTDAVNWLILTMPPPAQIFFSLEERMKDSLKSHTLATDERKEMYKHAPNAKELAEMYAPKIMEMLKRGVGRELPYDQNERIENDTKNNSVNR